MNLIELIGLPGAGKSTIVNSLIKNHDEYDTYTGSIKVNWDIFCLFKLLFLIILHFPMILYIISFSSFNKLPNNLKVLAYHLKLFLFLQKKLKNSNFLIIDQGILQSLVSVVVDTKSEIGKFGYIILKFYIKYYRKKLNIQIIFLFVEIATSFKRIRIRNSKTTRFDYWDDHKVKSNLRKYQSILNYIYQVIPNEDKELINSISDSKLIKSGWIDKK